MRLSDLATILTAGMRLARVEAEGLGDAKELEAIVELNY